MTTQRLFIYGSLGPGRPNHHVMEPIGGTWTEASVRAELVEEGWGAAMGFPAIRLGSESGSRVDGWVVESGALEKYWDMLDEFEGPGYARVLTEARTVDGEAVATWVYTLAPST